MDGEDAVAVFTVDEVEHRVEGFGVRLDLFARLTSINAFSRWQFWQLDRVQLNRKVSGLTASSAARHRATELLS